MKRKEAEKFVRDNVQTAIIEDNNHYTIWYMYDVANEFKGCGGCISLHKVTEKKIEELFEKMVENEMTRERIIC